MHLHLVFVAVAAVVVEHHFEKVEAFLGIAAAVGLELLLVDPLLCQQYVIRTYPMA